jgi:tetratricopeptide (TPR) repeat protein
VKLAAIAGYDQKLDNRLVRQARLCDRAAKVQIIAVVERQTMRIALRVIAAPILVSTLLCVAASAQDAGQQALDKATEKKLTAESLSDLNDVIRLCDEALKEGLDETNAKFANNLLVGTLVQRATAVTSAIFQQSPPDPRWPQLRGVAIQDLERAIKMDPAMGDAHYLIARLHTLPGGDLDRARKAADLAVEHSKQDTRAHARALVMRANLIPLKASPKTDEEKREAEKANHQRLTDYAAAIKAAPADDEAYNARGKFYLVEGKYQEAIKDFDEALKADPENLEARLLRARAYQQTGDAKKARAEVDEVLKDRPGVVAALELRASLAAGDRDFKQAIADLEELLKIAPDNATLLAQIGILYQGTKQPRAAIEKFDAALKQDKGLFMALRGRADAYLSIGKQAEAISDYEQAIKVNPKDSGVLNNLAWVLATSPNEKLRDGKRAIELATTACEVTEYKEAHILSTLAAAYAESGQWDEAVKWSKKAVELGGEGIDEQLKKELASYEQKKPWRERQEISEPQESATDNGAEQSQEPK